MALFTFKCLLGHRFDHISKVGQTPDSIPCIECGHTATRVWTAPAIHFKGDGFSRTSAP